MEEEGQGWRGEVKYYGQDMCTEEDLHGVSINKRKREDGEEEMEEEARRVKRVKLRKKKRKKKTQYGEEKLALINQKWNDMYGEEDPSAFCYLWFEDEVAQVHKIEGNTRIRFSKHVGCEYNPKKNTGRTLKK